MEEEREVVCLTCTCAVANRPSAVCRGSFAFVVRAPKYTGRGDVAASPLTVYQTQSIAV